MNSWRSFIPALGLVLAVATFAAACFRSLTDDPAPVAATLAAADPAPTPNARAVLGPARAAGAVARGPRPAGLLELTIGRIDQILLAEQRPALVAHLARIKLLMAVPDAMSFATRRLGPTWVLSAASAPGNGFFLFSEKPRKRLTSTGARKFLTDFFKPDLALTFNDREDKFLSRGAGEMTWLRGNGAAGQRFDAYLFTLPKTGFSHLLFIYDPTVANASRRLMVDSVRAG